MEPDQYSWGHNDKVQHQLPKNIYRTETLRGLTKILFHPSLRLNPTSWSDDLGSVEYSRIYSLVDILVEAQETLEWVDGEFRCIPVPRSLTMGGMEGMYLRRFDSRLVTCW